MTINEKVAYLKGLDEGLNLDTEKSKEGKLISVMIGILEEVGLSIEDLEENALALGEEIDVLSDDLADVESVVFDEDENDEEDYDDDWFEVECPTCEEPLIIDDEALAEGFIQCPNCQSKFSLDLSGGVIIVGRKNVVGGQGGALPHRCRRGIPDTGLRLPCGPVSGRRGGSHGAIPAYHASVFGPSLSDRHWPDLRHV